MDKASHAEKERCRAALEKAQNDLKTSKEKQKDMAAELHFYQDKEMREEEALEELEESTKASAQSGRKRQAEEGDEEVIFDVDFDLHDEGKSNMWGFKIRQIIVKLLVPCYLGHGGSLPRCGKGVHVQWWPALRQGQGLLVSRLGD